MAIHSNFQEEREGRREGRKTEVPPPLHRDSGSVTGWDQAYGYLPRCF